MIAIISLFIFWAQPTAAHPHTWKFQYEISSATNSRDLELALQKLDQLNMSSRACGLEIEWHQTPAHCFSLLEQQRQNRLISDEDYQLKLRQLNRLCRRSAPQSVVKLKALLKNSDLSSACRESLSHQLSIGLYKSENDPPTF